METQRAMRDPARVTLTAAVGARKWRDGLAAAQMQAATFKLDFADVSPIHRAFAPMAREQKFDVAEMAIVTALQAFAYGKPLLLLPVTVAARFQQRCIITRRAAPALTAEDLAGRRVGVRAYTQTTGMWIRGILHNDYRIAPETIRWVTQDDAHVAEYHDPAWVERTAPGNSLVDLLRAGDIDAAILGNDLPDDPDFVPVIPAPEAAAQRWFATHGVIPINHVMVVRRDVAAAHPDAVRELWQALHRAKPAATADGPDMAPIGIDANRRALAMVLRYCEQQKLLPRALTVDELFAGTIDVLGPALKD